MTWPSAIPLETTRLQLEPLTVAHADEMAVVLSAPALYAFTGGEPPTVTELRARYTRQAVGLSPDGATGWLNWVIRRADRRTAIGFVQTTLTVEQNELVAELAWLITPTEQGRGSAVESAGAVCTWLEAAGVHTQRALIHPDHVASARVARRLGFSPTPVIVDGEVRWESGLQP